MKISTAAISRVTQTLSRYIASSQRRRLPDDVVEKAKQHILDSIGAIISGTQLLPGRKAISYISVQGGNNQACIPGTRLITSITNAALANGMLAHADETNDFHADSYTQPGCSVVPAALVTAEMKGSDGSSFLKAVVLGYDITCRITMALDPMRFHKAGHCTHSFGGTFGSAAASAALLGLSADQVRHVLAYAAQQASGGSCTARDRDHIGMAFDYGGMPARNGVAAATMVAHGFTAVDDIFSGERNFLFAYNANPEKVIYRLGKDFEIMNASIKKYSTGSVILAPLESLRVLITKHKFKAEDVDRVVVWISQEDANVISTATMPALSLPYLMSIMLLDGSLTFSSTHSPSRMRSSAVRKMQKRIDLRGSEELSRSNVPRQGIVEVYTHYGKCFKHHTHRLKGMPNNPMSRRDLEEKFIDLVAPVLGKRRTSSLVKRLWMIDTLADVRLLRRYFCL